jgi:hypothetical protein
MRRTLIVAGLMAGVLAARMARASPADLRFGQTPPDSPYTTGLCRVNSDSDGAGRVWRVGWLPDAREVSSRSPGEPGFTLRVDGVEPSQQARQTPAPRPIAFDYSHGYEIRQKIHKYASIATVPLFVAETWLGQSLYNNPGQSESKKGAHGAVAASIGVLFGVNSVTGVWNLMEARKNPAGRTRRTVHGILMLVADAGFVATGALAPGDDSGEEGGNAGPVDNSGRRSTHRAVALTSMGIALASYVMMLVWRD